MTRPSERAKTFLTTSLVRSRQTPSRPSGLLHQAQPSFSLAPKIHYALGGVPKILIGNASNKFGEFRCVALSLSSLKLFSCITKKEKTNGIISQGADFENDLLVNTDRHDSGTEYVGCLLPNFFMIYFGQKTPTWDITSDNAHSAETVLSLHLNYFST